LVVIAGSGTSGWQKKGEKFLAQPTVKMTEKQLAEDILFAGDNNLPLSRDQRAAGVKCETHTSVAKTALSDNIGNPIVVLSATTVGMFHGIPLPTRTAVAVPHFSRNMLYAAGIGLGLSSTQLLGAMRDTDIDYIYNRFIITGECTLPSGQLIMSDKIEDKELH
jgi:hypothetical protein